MRKIVIIGFGSAGYAALSTLKRLGCRDEITVIDPKQSDLMHPCGIPYALEGIADAEKINQNISLERMGVRKIQGHVRGLDDRAKTVFVQTGEDEVYVPFDSLLICAGASPVIPPLKGIEQAHGNGLYTLVNSADLASVKENLSGKKSGIVMGAGAIGLEAAAALKKHLSSVCVIDMKNKLLPGVLDPDMADIVQSYLEEKGITFKLGKPVEELIFNDCFGGCIAGGEALTADIGICAAGFRPHCSIVKGTAVETGPLGIITDMHQQTSVKDIYAAGDCTVTRSVIDGKPIAAKLATSAYRQGCVAAYGLAGLQKEYRGSAGTFVTTIAGMEIAGTGFTTETARERGFDPVISKINSHIRPDYFLSNSSITVKIIADRKTGSILGAQCIGASGAAERINIISCAISSGIGLDRFEDIELAYCPAVSEVYDPLMRAAEGAQRRITR